MSDNPKSINYKPGPSYDGRAEQRQQAIVEATKATTGGAGLADGDAGKKAVENSDGSG
jgi:hypothetical protein